MDSLSSPVAVTPPLVPAPPASGEQAPPTRIARLREASHHTSLRQAIDVVLGAYFLHALVGLVTQREDDWGLPITGFALSIAWAFAYRILAQVAVDFIDLAAERHLPRDPTPGR